MDEPKENQHPSLIAMKNHQKTIFEKDIDKEFIHSTSKSPAPLVTKLRKVGRFYMSMIPERCNLISFYFELWDNYLFIRDKEGMPVMAYIDINYARVRLIPNQKVNEKTYSVLRFTKLKKYEELFCTDSNLAEIWFQELKEVCVLNRFRDHYRSLKVLGKGSFAKVLQ